MTAFEENNLRGLPWLVALTQVTVKVNVCACLAKSFVLLFFCFCCQIWKILLLVKYSTVKIGI